jgi:uncharacterized membrane protein
MELWRLFAHQHWFTVRAMGLELRLCARCSGYLAGFLSLMMLGRTTPLSAFQMLPLQSQWIICLILIIPSTADWLTQFWGLRESNNALRLITGISLGAAVSLYSSMMYMADSTLIFLSVISTIVAVGILGSPRNSN